MDFFSYYRVVKIVVLVVRFFLDWEINDFLASYDLHFYIHFVCAILSIFSVIEFSSTEVFVTLDHLSSTCTAASFVPARSMGHSYASHTSHVFVLQT